MKDFALVYVVGPYTAADPHQRCINIHNAWTLGAEVARLGAMPVVPHKCSEHLDALQPPEWWLAATLELMKRCDAAIFVPGWEASPGSVGERAEATRLRIPCFDSIDELRAWLVKPDRPFAETEKAPADAIASVKIKADCDHGVTFDEEAARGMSVGSVRTRWPRLFGECPKGCGFNGIGYASFAHYAAGDW